MTEARDLNHSYVGTEHLLLGLVREEKGIAAQMLVDAGITLEAARERVLEILGQPPRPRPRVARAASIAAMKLLGDKQGALTPATTSASAHMAASIIELLSQDTDVGAVFAAQGIDVAKLAEALRALATSSESGDRPDAEPPTPSPEPPGDAPLDAMTHGARAEGCILMNGYDFTDRVRMALGGAREEASRLGHDEVAAQHILLALLRRTRAWRRRDRVVRRATRPSRAETRGNRQARTRAARAANRPPVFLAGEEGARARHGGGPWPEPSHVGTHHLSARAHHGKRTASRRRCSPSFGITIDAARTHVLEILSSGKQDDRWAPATHSHGGRDGDGEQERISAPRDRRIRRGQRGACPRDVSACAQHPSWMAASILEALLQDPDIADVFAAQGIDARMLTAALRSAAVRQRPGDAPAAPLATRRSRRRPPSSTRSPARDPSTAPSASARRPKSNRRPSRRCAHGRRASRRPTPRESRGPRPTRTHSVIIVERHVVEKNDVGARVDGALDLLERGRTRLRSSRPSARARARAPRPSRRRRRARRDGCP